MSRTDAERLGDALMHVDVAVRYSASEPLDQKTIDAIRLRISAGIDSLHGLAERTRTLLLGDIWPQMWGMRNRIAHSYALVEQEVIVATVAADIPMIRAHIHHALRAP